MGSEEGFKNDLIIHYPGLPSSHDLVPTFMSFK